VLCKNSSKAILQDAPYIESHDRLTSSSTKECPIMRASIIMYTCVFIQVASLQDKPYAIFGTCLGAIVAYEIARVVEKEKKCRMPIALYCAAVSPPHLYAMAVMKLYMTRTLLLEEINPLDEVMEKLRGWKKLPKETLMLVSTLLYCIRRTILGHMLKSS
jgi:hypothetical protein